MSCYLCSPPFPLRSSGQWSTLMHEHHVKEFHLGPYKPFKCAVNNCQQSTTLKPLFTLHDNAKHRLTQPFYRGSKYLESLTDVMMQYNYYSDASTNGPHLASDMINTIQTQLTAGDEEQAPSMNEEQRNKTIQDSVALEQNSVSMLGKDTHYCSECKKTFGPKVITHHLADAHIVTKMPFATCNGCDYAVWSWCNSNMRKHLKRVHKGKVTFTDRRPNFNKQIGDLKEKLIKHTDGGVVIPYRPQRGKNKKVGHKRKRYCKKCKIWIVSRNVDVHLSCLSHVGKYCLQCNGCQFKTLWRAAKMVAHIKEKHPGTTVGYTDTRDEIGEKLKIEEELYIK